MMIPLALSYAGFAALCISMQRHHRDLFGKSPSRIATWTLRLTGYVLLALALWLCIASSSPSVGVLIWLGLISAATLLLVALMTWNPRVATWIGMAAPLALFIFSLAGKQG